MVVGIRDEAELADIALTLKTPADVRQTEWQSEVIALEQSLAKARREIEVLQTARETNRERDARTEVSITAALARFEALQEEKIALAAEVVELRDQLAASERARASEQAKVTALQKEKASLATQVASLRDQLAASKSARVLEQTKVNALQKEKTVLSGQFAKLRHELTISERKLKAVYKSTSWRITRPLRSVKLPSIWKTAR
ncbi:Chromosome partition protein Smc [Ensifer psoraleae]|uniref:hypothetical protein n=1 Tax=Sinorhizobium TaxID=28105 RepID=UPI001567FF40|nr:MULTISPECIES: hypothetical protein [Sinorhizobium]MDK1389753.1 hypothetical protein [Sinorhizobium sp. 7-81]NRP75226.1 Chromosome partition protein Smc [Sinorhizobium psoraleae]